jgi:hypothetical protein
MDFNFTLKFSHKTNKHLTEFIESNYFAGTKGKLKNNHSPVVFTPKDENEYRLYKGLDDFDLKLTCPNIEGYAKFKIKEDKDSIKLIPTSNHCIKRKDTYIFY